MKLKSSNYSGILAFVCNIVLVYVVYALCRLAFFLENYSMYADTIGEIPFWDFLKGCWMFDTSAILYTNALYAVLMLIPLHCKETRVWQSVAKWVFVVCNTVCVVANMIDCVYFQYTGRRTTLSVFDEFSNENNMFEIFSQEILNHWYIFLAGVALIVMLILLYTKVGGSTFGDGQNVEQVAGSKGLWRYYVIQSVAFLLYIPLTIIGMRGGVSTATRPITISNANQYVNRPSEAVLILNTPFAMIRTADKATFRDPGYYTQEELDSIYTPIHTPTAQQPTSNGQQPTANSQQPTAKNIVVLIVESFGREYIGAYNKLWNDPAYKTYTPFTDSLFNHCLSFDYTFSNGRKSIDGMPSILSGIPRFLEPFFLTSASLNDVSGIARELDSKDYYTAFFHGAENGSMGFQAFAKATGFRDYYGRTEYGEDPRFGGDDDFDGTWAIWDEPFLQYYALKMSEFKQPFMTAMFTASSHSPYVLPEEYKEVYPEEEVPIHKCIRYTDNSLRKFFDTAKRQPWYDNTLFIITSDHTNQSNRAEYQTDLGVFGSPILFFDPTGQITPGQRHCVAQQSDIMPTVLGYLGYDRPYVAFGQDLLQTADDDTWAVNHTNGIYQYVKGDYVIQFDGEKLIAAYNYKTDWFMKKNLLKQGAGSKEQGAGGEFGQMLRELKAIIQSYMQRMVNNELVVR